MTARASVVIPAHNEAAVIGRCLDTMLADADPGEFEVVVVCNGCSDDTAAAAGGGRRAGVQVLEIDAASKIAALNAGDDAATAFPRIYLDADISVDTAALRAVTSALEAGAPAAAPRPVVDTSRCGPVIRAYFAVWSRLGYATKNVLGAGFYAMSRDGRGRFERFPDIIADDGFVYCQFDADERVNPDGATFVIRAPRNLRALVRRRVRIVAGNRELQAATGLRPRPPGPDWRAVIKQHPRLAPSALAYLGVNAVAARSAGKRARSGTSGAWHQDRSSREVSGVASTQRRRAGQDLLAPRTWKQFARLANFFRYDGGERAQLALGAKVRLSPTTSIRNGARISIGAGAHIGQWSSLWAGDHHGRIEIGDHALLAPNVFLTASDYDFDAGDGPVMDLPKREADIRIGANTWLGANVVVVAGVTIGDGAIVAAGSVVTRDLPPGCVAAGVPARVVRERGAKRESA